MVMDPSTWITGVGTCSPLGDTFDAFADALLAGRCCLGRISTFPVDDHPSQIGGQLHQVSCPPGENPDAFGRLARLDQLARGCCTAALLDAGLLAERSTKRVGLVLGVGAGGLLHLEEGGVKYPPGAWQPPTPEASLVARTKEALRLSGPAVAVSAACASGNAALALARAWLRLGWVDVCLAGAADAAVTPATLAGFGNLRA